MKFHLIIGGIGFVMLLFSCGQMFVEDPRFDPGIWAIASIGMIAFGAIKANREGRADRE